MFLVMVDIPRKYDDTESWVRLMCDTQQPQTGYGVMPRDSVYI